MPTGIGYGLLGDLQPDVSGLTDRRGLAANDPETLRLVEEEQRRQMTSWGGLMDQPIPNALNAAGAGMFGAVGDLRELGGLLSQAGPIGPLQQLGQQLGNLPQGAPTSDEAAAMSGADLDSMSGMFGLLTAPDPLGPMANLASSAPLLAGRVMSTRVPRAVKPSKSFPILEDDPLDNVMGVTREEAKRDQRQYQSAIETFRDSPNVPRDLAEGGTPEEIDAYLIDHMAENLTFLNDVMGPAFTQRAKQWYVGANRFANQVGSPAGLSPEQSAGVMAVLSPQKDWFQNASQGERIIQTPNDIVGNSAMDSLVREWSPSIQKLYEKIRRTPANELAPEEAAILYRLYDQTNNKPQFRMLMPEGNLGNYVKTKKGAPRRHAWGSMREIAKAISIMRDGSPENIFKMLGQQAKVRSFYNNIADPFSDFGSVTADTHQVAANTLRPLSGSSPEVALNLGAGPTSAYTGISGTYPIHADAVREAAGRRGVLPREMQSITWEGVRAMFSPEQKRDKRLLGEARRVWDNYRDGKLSAGEARERTLELAGGLTTPDWARPGAVPDGKAPASTYERNLP